MGLNLANKISIARIILIPFFIASVVYGRSDMALVIFSIAVISDGADGFIARALKQKTKLGTVLDPVADKMLLMSAYICLSIADNIPSGLRLPPYVPIIVISRDVIIVTGSIMAYLHNGELNIVPSIIGKITTFFQMMTVVLVLLGFKYSYIVWNAAIILTVASGIGYVFKGSRLLSENNSSPKRGS
jgi:cardiolipin synthase